jgi:hypothetical protein
MLRAAPRLMRRAALVVGACAAAWCHADGLVVDKVYHPYVDALTTEAEWRSTFQDPQPAIANPSQVHQLSLGHSIGLRSFAELYASATRDPANDGLNTRALELEVKHQLTEQGEYSADWAVLVEFEKKLNVDVEEFALGLITEKEFGRFSGTVNLFLIEEWGADIKREFETVLATQLRYRYRRELEPALEFYAGPETRALGPVLQGDLRLGTRKNLHWESGVIFGLDSASPDKTLRFLFEYEF